MFVDSFQFSMAGRGQTWGCEEVQRMSLFTSGSTVGISPHALFDQSKSSLGNRFKDTSSQQVKRMLSRDCILVRFSWFEPSKQCGVKRNQNC